MCFYTCFVSWIFVGNIKVPILNLTSPQIVKIICSYLWVFKRNLSWATRNILTKRITCSTNIRSLDNSLFFCFCSGLNSWFFDFFCGVWIDGSPMYALSPLNFCLLAKPFFCSLNKLISLLGPGAPAVQSTISAPWGKTISWFFKVWFFFFPE